MNEKEPKSPKNKKRRSTLWKWSKRIVLTFLLFFVVLLISIQIPFVQESVISQITTQISERTETKVNAEGFRLRLFNSLSLNGLYIEDHNGDTLLYAKDFQIRFKNPIYSYLKGDDFLIKGIELKEGGFYQRKRKGETQTNVEIFLEAFDLDEDQIDSDTTRQNKSGFVIDLKEIVLENAEFVRQDSVVGSYQQFYIENGFIYPDKLDFERKEILIKDVILKGPAIKLSSFPGTIMEFDEPSRTHTMDSKGIGPKPWLIQLRQFNLSDGKFQRSKLTAAEEPEKPSDVIDWQAISLDEIEIDVSDFNLYNWNFDGCLNKVALRSSSGFTIRDFRANYVHVDTGLVDIDGAQLTTSVSELLADLELRYNQFSDFKEFVDSVEIRYLSQKTDIQIGDLIKFAPALNQTRFFRESQNQLIKLKGNISGPVNELEGKNVSLQLGQKTQLEGNFESQNLSNGNEAYVSASIFESHSSMRDLRRIIPGFSVPSNFDNLGRLRFRGDFNGAFKDFIAEGKLFTDIGQAEMRMKMDVRDGPENAKYSGNVNLINFDLGAWNENDEFGKTNIYAEVPEGRGLGIEYLSTRILATIEGFTYKSYTFNNFNMNGTFDGPLFNGKFDILDEFLDLSFRGKVDFAEELPKIDIDADVVNLHLGELKITEKDIQLSGGVQVRVDNYKLNELTARVELENFIVLQNDTVEHKVDSLVAYSRKTAGENRELQFHSSQIDLNLSGRYKPTHLWSSFLKRFSNDYPKYASFLDIDYDSTKVSSQKFTMDLQVHDTEDWLELLNPKIDSIYNANLNVFWNDDTDSIYMESFVPHLKIGNQEFHNAYVYLNSKSGLSNVVSYADSLSIGNQFGLESFTGQFDFNQDTTYWALNVLDGSKSEDRFNFEGKSFLVDTNFAVKLLNQNFEFFYDSWTVNPQNLLQVNSKFIRLSDFDMEFQDRIISIRSINDQGVSLNLENLDLSLLNDVLVSKKINYEGILSASIRKPNIFEVSALKGNLNIDSLVLNQDEYGTLNIDFSSDLKDSPLRVDGQIQHPDQSLSFNGFLFAEATGVTSDFYALDVQLDRIPLHILTYFVENGISNVEGHVTGKFKLSGELDKPIMKGEGLIQNGAVTIDFLGIRLFIENQLVRLEENFINASNSEISDIYGNTASLVGGLRHDYFRDLTLDLNIKSNKFLLLNTTEDDGIMYYGHCMGSAEVNMSGPLGSPNIDIIAENKEDTRFYLRTDYIEEDVTAGFFRYEDFDDTTSTKESELQVPMGINFSLDLTANDRAEVEIIIDKKTGDIIRGRGQGNIRFNLNRAGEITMFGDYEITQGQYLFTSQVFIQKPFTVATGSTIQWTGDPLDAIINIKAQYNVFTSPYFLVQEMVTQPDQIREFQNNTVVILNVNLTGLLYSPQLDFTIEFPNLTGPTRSIVENKLSLLEADPNEMYKQAGALIVLNTFVPSAVGGGKALGAAAGVNTLSEFVSSQFSNVISTILRSAVEDVEFIDDIDLDLNYNVGTDDLLRGEGLGISSGEFRISTTARLFDRVELDVGTNYYVGNQNSVGASESGTFFTGNFALQYALTEDRQLKLRVYSLSDQVLEGRRFRSGVGIRHQKEFNSFGGFYSALESAAQKLRMMPEDNTSQNNQK
ncbi:MAG: hypothetical protein GVX78_04655 [Bacteroidetes bacterium]|jgi:hypothetical protein|nr:hypothetical protein [Bacteroidota bacterium]